MDTEQLVELLKKVANHSVSVENAEQKLRELPFHDMGFAKIDHHRAMRTGYPEIIFCQNKSVEHIVKIAQAQIAYGETVFGTRAEPEVLEAVAAHCDTVEVNTLGRCFWSKAKTWKKKELSRGNIVIAAAGTADVPVAEEAKSTVEILGHSCTAVYDVGVAGIHRLLAHKDVLLKASVIITIAGMEGALPSVIAGLVSCPVIGVPTSVGYGSHMNGMVPLFAMLNSCASGLTVVNIDNGFGAGFAACSMVDMIHA